MSSTIIIPDRKEMELFMQEAIAEARRSYDEGGVPIGSVLVRNGEIIARGYNRRVQHGDPTAHAEINCIRNAGRLGDFRDTIIYSTLMPCAMCAGAAIQFRVPIVVAGEDRTFESSRKWMESSGIKVVDLDLDECYDLLQLFAKIKPDVWKEDIGEV